MSEPFGSLSLEHSSTVDRVADELRRAVFDGELESGTPLREVALAESLGVSRPTVREALGGPGRRGPGHPRAQPRRLGRHARPGLGPRRLPGPGGARGRRRPPLADARPERPGDAVRDRAGRLHRARSHDGASYQVLNERHLAFHLVAGRADRVAAAGGDGRRSLYAELRLALAQVDRIRRNAHDQADSHTAAGAAARGRRHRRDRRPSSRSTSPTPRSRSSTGCTSSRVLTEA